MAPSLIVARRRRPDPGLRGRPQVIRGSWLTRPHRSSASVAIPPVLRGERNA